MVQFKTYYRLICEVTVDQVKTRLDSKPFKRAVEIWCKDNNWQSYEYAKTEFDNLALKSLPQDIEEYDKGNALNWIISTIIKNPSSTASAHDIRPALEIFYQIKRVKPNLLPVRAIEQIASFEDLIQAVRQAKPAYDKYLRDKAEKDTRTDINQSKVFENEEWNVYVPKTKGAAIQLGKGTDWCTAAPGLQYYEQYTSISPLIIFVHKEEPEEWRYQFWYGDDEQQGQFMDIHDESITNGVEQRKIFFHLNDIVKQLNINDDVQKRAEQYKYEKLDNGGYVIATPDRIQYFNSNNKLDRADGSAAYIKYSTDDTREIYYRNGLVHREDGPAVIVTYQSGEISKDWYQNGKRMQSNKHPNQITRAPDGRESWSFRSENGIGLHREGGPALKMYDGTLEWRVRGYLHNPDGPAIIHPNGDREYYLKDIAYTEEDFNNKELWKQAVYDSQFKH